MSKAIDCILNKNIIFVHDLSPRYAFYPRSKHFAILAF